MIIEEDNDPFRYELHLQEYNQVKRLEKQIQDLQIDYDSKYETYKELNQTKKIKKLKETFNEKNMILNKKKEKFQEIIDDYVKKKRAENKMELGTVSKMQYFMDTLKKLEGENRSPVSHQTLVRTLCGISGYAKYGVKGSGIFSRESANTMIRKMLREASIYESKPGYYNRV